MWLCMLSSWFPFALPPKTDSISCLHGNGVHTSKYNPRLLVSSLLFASVMRSASPTVDILVSFLYAKRDQYTGRRY